MKKLLTAIALVLALCLPVFAFAACSQEDEIKGEQLQGEEQWRQAFADTVAARKNNCTLKMSSDFVGGDMHGIDYHMESYVKYDSKNHLLYLEGCDNYYKSTSKRYTQLNLGEEFIFSYGKETRGNFDNEEIMDSGWQIYETICLSEESAIKEFASLVDYGFIMGESSRNSMQKYPYNSKLIELEYALTETGEGQNLSELFSAFTFDSATSKYSASLYALEGQPMDISLTFSNGKLAKLETDLTMYDDGGESHEVCNIEYIYTCDTITIPEDAKNGVLMGYDYRY